MTPMSVGSRHRRLVDEMTADTQALVVTTGSNIRYLTGFTGSSGALVVTPGSMTLITDGRYAEQAPEQIDGSGATAEVVISPSTDEAVASVLLAQGVGVVGLESDSLSWARYQRLAELLADVDVIGTPGLVERIREIKDDGEIDRIGAAAALVDAALAEVGPMLFDGVTEMLFAAELDAEMRRRGASDRSFETIVASGPRAALPHARPSDRVIAAGDLVVVDCGAIVDGYCSDMTRTFAIGEVDETLSRVLEVVVAAHDAGVAAVRPGVETSAVDAAARSVIEDAGWGESFTHGTGHGVGLDIHEAPRVSKTANATLRPGHVITVEPGVYLPGVGGARFEDLLVVEPDGSAVLTRSPQVHASQ